MMSQPGAVYPSQPYCYMNANAGGFAAWTFDIVSSFVTNSQSLIKDGFPNGVLGLTRLFLPQPIPVLNGYITVAWRKATGTGGANAYIGAYTLADGTLTQVYGSPDQSASGYGPLRLGPMSINSLPPDGPTGGFYVGCLVGTQDSVGMGPTIAAGGQADAIQNRNTTGYPPPQFMQYGSGLSVLPVSIPLASCTIHNATPYCMAWYAID